MNKLIERREYLDKLFAYKDKHIIKVVTGLRRSGKSTLLEIFKEKLMASGVESKQIQFYNFELPENFLDKSWDTISICRPRRPDCNSCHLNLHCNFYKSPLPNSKHTASVYSAQMF